MTSAPQLIMLALCAIVFAACAAAWLLDLLRWRRGRRDRRTRLLTSLPAATPDQEIADHIAARAFSTGNLVFAERLEDGTIEVWEMPSATGEMGKDGEPH